MTLCSGFLMLGEHLRGFSSGSQKYKAQNKTKNTDGACCWWICTAMDEAKSKDGDTGKLKRLVPECDETE